MLNSLNQKFIVIKINKYSYTVKFKQNKELTI